MIEGDTAMKILEEFWYGNIEPAEYDSSPCKEYHETLKLISRNEEKLLATMTDEQKTLIASGNFNQWQSACCSRTASAWEPE